MKNTTKLFLLISALATLTLPVQAAVLDNEFFLVDIPVFVPCAADGAGEIVDLSGSLHVLISMTINGNNVSGVMHDQPQGIIGTGETTGDKYQGTGVTATSFKMSLQNGQADQTFINNFRIIGQASGNNLLMHEVAHGECQW
jgi:hypothetical protein